MKGTLEEISAEVITADWEVGQSKVGEEVSHVGRNHTQAQGWNLTCWVLAHVHQIPRISVHTQRPEVWLRSLCCH